MQKLVLFILLLMGVWYVRRLWAQGEKDASGARPETPPRSERMCECRSCGVLVPESEGMVADGEFFCSAEHARNHAAARKNES